MALDGSLVEKLPNMNYIRLPLRTVRETVDHMCIKASEADVRIYRNLLLNHKMIFFTCLMPDVLAVLNTLSLAC